MSLNPPPPESTHVPSPGSGPVSEWLVTQEKSRNSSDLSSNLAWGVKLRNCLTVKYQECVATKKAGFRLGVAEDAELGDLGFVDRHWL
jgi:hypothetical protein